MSRFHRRPTVIALEAIFALNLFQNGPNRPRKKFSKCLCHLSPPKSLLYSSLIPEMSFIPQTNARALRHLSTVEIDATPLVHIFCVGPSVKAIRKSYRKLALLVHPDRVCQNQKRGSQMCMSIISRAIDQVNKDEAYDNIVRNQPSRGRPDDLEISPTVVFTRSGTKKENTYVITK